MTSIIVCIKQVPDPEAPASVFEVDSDMKRMAGRISEERVQAQDIGVHPCPTLT